MSKDAEPPKSPEDLLVRIAGMLLAGARDDEVHRVAKGQGWTQKKTEITKAIKSARDNFLDILGVDQTTATGISLARLSHILAKSLQIQDYKTAFAIQNQITELLLSSPDVILGPEIGRPPAKIDKATVFGMASVGATNTEIAEVCGVEESTIRKRFPKELKSARAQMKKKLRRAQLAKALEGNPTMLIWLGKQMLDQKEKADLTSGDAPLPHSVKVVLVKPKNDEKD